MNKLEITQNISFKKLGVLHCNTYIFFEETDILYCSADSNYTDIYLCNEKKYRVSKPLAKVSKMLTQEIFLRINQSYLVNHNFITGFNREKCVVLIGETELKVSTRNKS
ncbi:MAG: hypothetical protein A2033_12845 [Bacteroidetes bacterium GWA2_31_9]|nr:MAG: hypothetical protein A2033_12845 [Bacteroidetes bacterium GWA2_31_9]